MSVQPDISRAGAVALVLDVAAPDVAEIADRFVGFGGGWREGIHLWRGLGMMPYLILIAPNRYRIKRRAPYTVVACNLTALELAVRTACDMLEDVTCAWFLALGPEAHGIVNDMIHVDSRTRLAAAAPRGRA
jgi:hypothetical protein